MKRQLLLPTARFSIALVILSLVYACSKKEVGPADQTDALSNTNWEAYGYKNPVNNKDIYYYLAFSVNGKGHGYSRYNKVEPTTVADDTFIYTLVGSKLTLIYPTENVELGYVNDRIQISQGWVVLQKST